MSLSPWHGPEQQLFGLQLTSVAAVAAVATVAGRVLRHPRLAPLRLAIWSASALFLGWRFTHAGFSRMVCLSRQQCFALRYLQKSAMSWPMPASRAWCSQHGNTVPHIAVLERGQPLADLLKLIVASVSLILKVEDNACPSTCASFS